MPKLTPTLPDGLSIDDVMLAIADDCGIGFCLTCGAERYGCEPDACNYPCEDCIEYNVFGAEEILFMFVP